MRAMSTSSYHGHLVRSVKVEDMWEVLFLVPAGLRSLVGTQLSLRMWQTSQLTKHFTVATPPQAWG